MKVCIKYNQVEVALQALHGSVEEVVFGAAPLPNKQKFQYIWCLVFLLLCWRSSTKLGFNILLISWQAEDAHV